MVAQSLPLLPPQLPWQECVVNGRGARYNPRMLAEYTPMRWPEAWKDPSALDFLKGTVVNCLLLQTDSVAGAVAARARQEGFLVADSTSAPSGVTLVDGEWPGVKLTETGALDRASAGPTGVPWVDSNGWKIRLEAALHPGSILWVQAAPRAPRLSADAYVVAVADAAAHGACWVISLDEGLAAGLTGGRPDALEVWKRVTGAAAFFRARKDWSGFLPKAVVGIISDFAGDNEFMSHELLNLVARTNQQYLVLPKVRVPDSTLDGLKAVIYADAEPPPPGLRKQVLTFVQRGGMLITDARWGQLPGVRLDSDHPRYGLRSYGKGKLAVCKADFDDPYVVANDSLVLVSHRYELLRFWNGGAVGSQFTVDPRGRRAVVHLIFYALPYWGNYPTVRIAGDYGTARLWTLDQPAPRSVGVEADRGALEIFLPPVSQYAALELGV